MANSCDTQILASMLCAREAKTHYDVAELVLVLCRARDLNNGAKRQRKHELKPKTASRREKHIHRSQKFSTDPNKPFLTGPGRTMVWLRRLHRVPQHPVRSPEHDSSYKPLFDPDR